MTMLNLFNPHSLENFRNLNFAGRMGTKWFDSKVWKANNLQYIEQPGKWNTIFRMISVMNRHCYFPRGLSEIVNEAKQYPDLAIEERLVLIYDRDFRFYLSKVAVNAGAIDKRIIASALKKAKDTGLIDRLVRKYWANDFKTLNYDQRIKIYLTTPK